MTIENGTKTPMLKVYVIANGIKKRCRKTSRKMLKLGNHSLDANRDLLKVKALELVKSEMKTIDYASVHFDHVEIEQNDGYSMESWLMFDEKHVKEVLIDNRQL